MKLVKMKTIIILIFIYFIVDLRNELTKEQGSRQKLEQDILEIRRNRSKKTKQIRIKKSFQLTFF